MAFECPCCHSDAIQKYSIVYQNGTSNVQLNTYGGGISSGGHGGGYAYSTGTSQSQLAASVAPPEPKSTIWKYCFATLGAALFLGGLFRLDFNNILSGIVYGGGFGFWAYKSNQYNNTEYRELYEKWQRSYICLKCGHRFMI